MIDFEREQLRQNRQWRRVLEAYRHAGAEQKDADGWLKRLESVDGVAEEQLPRIHGRLIALGLLKFSLAGRQSGICYQLSSSAQRLLDNRELQVAHGAQ